MKGRTLGFIIAAIAVLTFVFAVPIWSAQSPGGSAQTPGCLSCTVHYQNSLSCQVFGDNLGTGDYIYQGSLSFGCGPTFL